MKIVEFIRDRLADDEQTAQAAAEHETGAARVLRQCAAFRRILAEEIDNHVHLEGAGQTFDHEEADQSAIFRGLASVWSDHPDYRPEWAEG